MVGEAIEVEQAIEGLMDTNLAIEATDLTDPLMIGLELMNTIVINMVMTISNQSYHPV